MSATTTCPECGMPPGQCYRICPTQDPYQGDQQRENDDYEFNARYDRWDGWGDPDLNPEPFDARDPADAQGDQAREQRVPVPVAPDLGDDIPF